MSDRHFGFVLGVGVLAFAVGLGCSSADEHPLGGPYGGVGTATPPSTAGGDPASTGAAGSPTGTIGGGPSTGGAGTGGTGTGGAGTGGTTDAGGTGSGTGGATDAGTGGTADAGTVPPPPPPAPAAPTWTQIWQAYLSPSSKGKCAASGCHGQMATAAGTYSYLQARGHISGTTSSLVNTSTSRLSWYGGDMPPSGPSSWAQAVADMNAWAAAGALQN